MNEERQDKTDLPAGMVCPVPEVFRESPVHPDETEEMEHPVQKVSKVHKATAVLPEALDPVVSRESVVIKETRDLWVYPALVGKRAIRVIEV